MAMYDVFQSVTGKPLEKAFWPAQNPKAIVQFVHGMGEHIRRYDAPARRLNEAGYSVVGHTHLGHGNQAEILGYFADRGGWQALIDDVHSLRTAVQAQYPDLPYFLLGHSMGSFVVRGYALEHEEGLKGVILSGTGHYDKGILTLGRTVARLQCLLGMGKKQSKLIEKLSSSDNNKGYDDVQTDFDWLSRDRAQVRNYMDDPYCGFTFTAGAYYDMFGGMKRLYPEKLGAMKKDIPVYLFSGSMDPVGAHGEGVKQVAQEIRNAGVEDVQIKLYDGGRHEMFNEINAQEVTDDLTAWLDAHL